MESTPLISVILPIYNIENFMDRCMESVLSQTYKNLEIIMVDDGATDSCPQMCDEYARKDSRIVVYHKQNGGLSDARNYGIERAKGEYITCIDPDDCVDKDYVEYLYNTLIKYKAKMSICQHRVQFDSGKVDEHGAEGDEKLETTKCLERLLYHDVIDTSAWAKLYHKSLFKEVRYPKGKLFEDIATTYLLMLQCEYIAVGYLSKYTYFVRSNSIVTSAFKPAKLDMIEMTDNMADYVDNHCPQLKEATLRRRGYARLSTLNQMAKVKEPQYIKKRKEIVKYLKANRKAICANPKTPKRDKIAYRCLALGYPVYKLAWGLFLKLQRG